MLVTVSTYSFPYEAHIAKAKLDAEGIPAFVADEHTINMQWLFSNAMGGVKLQVPQTFVERALDILSEDDEAALLQQQGGDFPVCPQCGSADTEYYRIGKRWAFLVFLGIDFPLFPTKDGIRCQACGAISET